jgi:hypothetical protein
MTKGRMDTGSSCHCDLLWYRSMLGRGENSQARGRRLESCTASSVDSLSSLRPTVESHGSVMIYLNRLIVGNFGTAKVNVADCDFLRRLAQLS